LTSVSSGRFVTYTAVFLDFGALGASVDLESFLLLFEPLPRLIEVVAEDGPEYLPSMHFIREWGWARRESTNVNIRVRFRMRGPTYNRVRSHPRAKPDRIVLLSQLEGRPQV